jgi:flagella basal body P-ring formation protein FlgA
MALGTAAQAEIYESVDAEGNPVFTDTPTAGVEEVQLQQENIADAVKAPPQSAPEQTAKSPPAKNQETHGNVTVIPDSRNEELSRELAADKPHEVLDAEKRYEVGDEITPEEAQRREQAKEGEYIDEQGNTVRVEHQGHKGR